MQLLHTIQNEKTTRTAQEGLSWYLVRIYLRTGEREAAADSGPNELRRSHTSRSTPVVAKVRAVKRHEIAVHSLQAGGLEGGVSRLLLLLRGFGTY